MTEIDRMIGIAANADNAPVLHRDIDAAAIGAQDACRMDPCIGFALYAEIGVDPWLHGLLQSVRANASFVH
jgi:hypothetical protein